MAFYRLSAAHISRRQGRTAVGAAAYRCGGKLYYKDKIYDYTKRNDIIHSEIILPDNAPIRFLDRQTLWLEVENVEKRKDARTAHEFILALPRILSFKTDIIMIKNFIDFFIEYGIVADFSIHKGDNKEQQNIEINHLDINLHNPHSHILLTTRTVRQDGFNTKKARLLESWGDSKLLIQLRERWADIQNKMFQQKGLNDRVSHESYTTRGIDREPTKHLGPAISEMERRGIKTRRGDENRAIIEINRNKEIEIQKKRSREKLRERSR